MTREPTAEQFLCDVSKHELMVLLDQGTYRHLRLAQPKNSNMWFDVVTWPGNLTIRGDMGTWTFSRVPDMFTFFRDEKLRVNADYWAEKIEGGVHGGRESAKIFDDDLFRSQLLGHLDNYDLEPEDRECVVQALRDEFLNQDNKYDLMISARDFSHKFPGGRKFYFDPSELPDGKEYSYHFIWCLYAIVWAIQRYDAIAQKTANGTGAACEIPPEATTCSTTKTSASTDTTSTPAGSVIRLAIRTTT